MKTLSQEENFLGLEDKFSRYDSSDIVIISAPLEKTVSYGKGTAKGPKAILQSSPYLEFYDEETDRELCLEKGIATLPELQLDSLTQEEAIEQVYSSVKSVLDDGKFAVVLGGEHSLSSAVARAYDEKFENLSILQFDAHSDLRDSYEGSKYSHASVMKRIFEFNKNITQVGIRAQCKEEADLIKSNRINTFYARDIRDGKHGTDWQSKVIDSLKENVFITFDVDGLDPSVISGTGTPEPGGLLWDETMNLLKAIGQKKTIVGFDVVELAPIAEHDISSFSTAKLVYKLLNYSFQ